MADKKRKSEHYVDTGDMESEIFEPDDEVKEEFAEASRLGDTGRLRSPEGSPTLSGGDIDAAWDQADASGEETVGGSSPTPDQDVVDELGEAVGLTYRDDEQLDTAEKIAERDRHRWELEPQSSEDYLERSRRKP
ncbi:MAG: hypothetical protein IPM66_15240 [Acidobacteriota bacterium]|nr:MAG: hypothetical protein IPM66_15240 [Acidobacteriota bacterium]